LFHSLGVVVVATVVGSAVVVPSTVVISVVVVGCVVASSVVVSMIVVVFSGVVITASAVSSVKFHYKYYRRDHANRITHFRHIITPPRSMRTTLL